MSLMRSRSICPSTNRRNPAPTPPAKGSPYTEGQGSCLNKPRQERSKLRLTTRVTKRGQIPHTHMMPIKHACGYIYFSRRSLIIAAISGVSMLFARRAMSSVAVNVYSWTESLRSLDEVSTVVVACPDSRPYPTALVPLGVLSRM